MSETRKFLKKYVINEAGEITKEKNGKPVKVKKGVVKLDTVKGKKKFKVSELLATYFPKEKTLDDNGEKKEEEKSDIEVVEKKISRPQQIRDYYDADPDGFNEKECSEQLSLPPSLVKRISELHIGKAKEPKEVEKTESGTNLIIEIGGKRYSINAIEL